MHERLDDFGTALLDPRCAVPDGVVGPDGLPSEKRFAVYRNNVTVSLIDALAAAYPVVQRLVGEAFFRAMARIHVAESPPRSPVMLHYGSDFPGFIERFPPARSVPYLADVARLERGWLEAYHAADARPMSHEAIAALGPETFFALRLSLHPSLRLIRSRWPIVSIWQANQPPQEPGPLDLSRGETALVLRPDYGVQVRSVAHGTAHYVAALASGHSAGEAALKAMAADPYFNLAGHLTELVKLGLIVGLTDSREGMGNVA